jgi:hypothetical protein
MNKENIGNLSMIGTFLVMGGSIPTEPCRVVTPQVTQDKNRFWVSRAEFCWNRISMVTLQHGLLLAETEPQTWTGLAAIPFKKGPNRLYEPN